MFLDDRQEHYSCLDLDLGAKLRNQTMTKRAAREKEAMGGDSTVGSYPFVVN